MTESFDRDLARTSAARLKDKRRELSELAIPPGRGWHPRRDEMAKVLDDTPSTIGAVIHMLQEAQLILDDLPPSQAANRVSAFNALYLLITKRVDGALVTGVNSPEFLEMLDVEFAKRYFAALGQWNRDEEETPDVWEVLFKRAADERLSRLVAAMLGVNAHINHDLAVSLVDICDEWGIDLDEGTTQHRDYLVVNTTLERVEGEIKARYTTGIIGDIDRLAGPLDDVLANWSVARARDNAWTTARTIRALRDKKLVFRQFMDSLARNVGFAGRALLVRTAM